MNTVSPIYRTRAAVAKLYGVAPCTVSQWIARGHLIPSFWLGDNWGATDQDLTEFEARRQAMTGQGSHHPARVLGKVGKKGVRKKLPKK